MTSFAVGEREAESTAAAMLRAFAPFVRANWRGFVPAFVGIVGSTLVALLKPWPLKFLIDDVLQVQDGEAVPEFSLMLVALVAGALVLLAAVSSVLTYVTDYFLTLTGQRIGFAARRALFDHVQRLSLSFHDRQRTGDLMTRVTSDVAAVQQLVTDKLLVGGVTSVLQFVGMLIVILVIDWRLGLIALSWAPFVLLISTYFRRRIRQEERLLRTFEGRANSIAQETMSSIRVVKAFGAERDAVARFDEHTSGMLDASVRVARLEGRFSVVMSIATAAGLAAVVFVGAYQVRAGALTVGTLVVVIQYMRDMQSPLNSLSRLWARLAKVMVRGERILEILDERPEIADRPDARPAPRLRGAVVFERVSFGYDPGVPVLREVDLSIEPGETVALVGPTGAGKSTLANLLLRLYEPTTGRVLVDGIDIRDYQLESYLSRVGVVLQESLLFQTTVRENIGYGKPRASDHEIEQAARIAHCDEFLARLPDGLDTVIGERGTTLSGGQRQRVAIARAIIRDAPLLVLDEPTTGLDAEAEATVMDALEELMRGRTTLLIAHKLSTVRRASRIAVLEHGRLVEVGTHEELLVAGGPYERAYRLQAFDLDSPMPAGGAATV